MDAVVCEGAEMKTYEDDHVFMYDIYDSSRKPLYMPGWVQLSDKQERYGDDGSGIALDFSNRRLQR